MKVGQTDNHSHFLPLFSMRKHIFLFLALMLTAATGLYAQLLTLNVSGQVTDLSGSPIANHTVYAIGDTSVMPPVFGVGTTNASGNYQISIAAAPPALGTVGFLVVATVDCNGSYQTGAFLTYTANGLLSSAPVNFQICASSGGGTNCTTAISHTTNSSNSFTFTGTVASPATSAVVWSMGDGTSYSNINPVSHSYSTNGTYYVSLTVVDSFAQCVATAYDTVVVTGVSGGATCYANFWGMLDSTGTVAMFQNMSFSTSGNPLQYAWTFNNGATSTLENPILTGLNGPLVACLTITDSLGGCTATYCDSLFILPPPPPYCQAAFSYDDSALVVNFLNLSMFVNPMNPGTSFWTFGDGSSSSVVSPIHTYAAPGVYNVCLTITDSFCTSMFCDSIVVTGGVPSNFFVAGQVTTPTSAGNFAADYATVYLIALDTTNMSLTAIDSVSITPMDSGFYAFSNLPAGSYAVKAALTPASASYSAYLPTYFSNSLFWMNATWIPLPGPFSGMQNIQLMAGNNPGGPGFIGGSVFAGANKNGAGMGNVSVLLLDANMNPVAVATSAADGSFNFNNIAFGSYLVYVDMLNRTTTPAPITLSSTTTSISNLEIEVGSENISYTTSVADAFDASLSAVYPNPTAASAAFDLSLSQTSDLTVEITSVVGQQMSSQTTKLAAGKHTISLDTENLPAGVYLVRVKDSNGAGAVRRLVKE